jgi:hypothetical protein
MYFAGRNDNRDEDEPTPWQQKQRNSYELSNDQNNYEPPSSDDPAMNYNKL